MTKDIDRLGPDFMAMIQQELAYFLDPDGLFYKVASGGVYNRGPASLPEDWLGAIITLQKKLGEIVGIGDPKSPTVSGTKFLREYSLDLAIMAYTFAARYNKRASLVD